MCTRCPHQRESFVRTLGRILYTSVLVAAAAVQAAEVTVTWSPGLEPHVTGYRVYYGPESGTYTQSIGTGTETSAILTNLTEGATYYCAVTVINAFDVESGYSNEISFVVEDAPLPGTLDSDGDGLPDAFEEAYGGGADLHPLSDLDGDGLSALAEYAHGLDPTAPLEGPAVDVELFSFEGESYLCVRYLLNPSALELVDVRVERRVDLEDENGWIVGDTIPLSNIPSVDNPGLLEVTERSPTPISAKRMEFFRIRHTVLTP